MPAYNAGGPNLYLLKYMYVCVCVDICMCVYVYAAGQGLCLHARLEGRICDVIKYMYVCVDVCVCVCVYTCCEARAVPACKAGGPNL